MPISNKLLATLCSITLLCMCTISPASATNEGITPYMEHIALGQCALNIDNSIATVNAWVRGNEGTTKTTVEVELQEQFLLFFWQTVDTWSSNSSSTYCRAFGTRSVTSGKTYRAVATVTAWVGNDSETQTITTETVVAD